MIYLCCFFLILRDANIAPRCISTTDFRQTLLQVRSPRHYFRRHFSLFFRKQPLKTDDAICVCDICVRIPICEKTELSCTTKIFRCPQKVCGDRITEWKHPLVVIAFIVVHVVRFAKKKSFVIIHNQHHNAMFRTIAVNPQNYYIWIMIVRVLVDIVAPRDFS